MIKLYQLPPIDRVPSLSPFCMKVETYLRMTGVAFESITVVDPRKGPKGKIPYIEDGAKRIGDSGLILQHLRDTRRDQLDDHLQPADRAAGHALRRMLEEHFYFAMVYARWFDAAHWPRLRAVLLAQLPRPLQPLIGAVALGAMRRTMHAHGIGRHAKHEVFALGRADLTALSDWLGVKPYLLGETPSSFDAVAHAFVANVVHVDMETPLRAHAMTLGNLVAYSERMTARYYPESLTPS